LLLCLQAKPARRDRTSRLAAADVLMVCADSHACVSDKNNCPLCNLLCCTHHSSFPQGPQVHVHPRVPPVAAQQAACTSPRWRRGHPARRCISDTHAHAGRHTSAEHAPWWQALGPQHTPNPPSQRVHTCRGEFIFVSVSQAFWGGSLPGHVCSIKTVRLAVVLSCASILGQVL
jgi:hypothetical protein